MKTHRYGGVSAQRGLSPIVVMFSAILVICVGLIVAQVVPIWIEKQTINKAVNAAKNGSTADEVRAIFDRAAIIDDIHSISGKDLVVSEAGDMLVVSYAYEREIPLFGPAVLVLRYQG